MEDIRRLDALKHQKLIDFVLQVSRSLQEDLACLIGYNCGAKISVSNVASRLLSGNSQQRFILSVQDIFEYSEALIDKVNKNLMKLKILTSP